MKRSLTAFSAVAILVTSLGVTSTAEARKCRYMTKTAGAVVGGVGGAVLGGVLTHGSTGPILGAVAGGVAGHEIARKNRYKCRGYYRRSTRR